MRSRDRLRRVLSGAVLAVLAAGAVVTRADVAPAPAWRLGGGASVALVHANTVYLGGAFTRLFAPSSSEDQFYDLLTGQPRPQCARSTHAARSLGGMPDGRGGLLVVMQAGNTYADADGPFAPPAGTTIVRVAADCRWDRAFAAPSIDPGAPEDLSIGLPVVVGAFVLASNSVVDPNNFLRAQVASFDAATGARVSFQFYQGVAEIGFFGGGPQTAVARVRDSQSAVYTLGAVTPSTLALTRSQTTLADEGLGSRTWVRATTLYRSRPAPANTLEAYDIASLAPRGGWTSPEVPALTDVEVVGARLFLTGGTVNGQLVAQPAALAADTGALDATWTPPALTRRTPEPSGTVYVPTLTALATDGQRLYFSGDFERVGATDRDGVAALVVSTATLDPWDPAPRLVSPLEYTDGGLLMTRPTGTNRVTRRYLAAIDRATGVATPWDPNDAARVLMHTASPVSSMATDGVFLYFASATTGEVLRAELGSADVDQNWRVVVSRPGGLPGTLRTMVHHAGVLYLGGDFESIAGTAIAPTARHALAAVGTDGALRGWAPVLEGPPGVTLIRALLPLGATVFLAGDFTTVNNQFRLGFGAVEAVTAGLVQPELFVLGDTRIHGLATDGERVFVAGESFGAPLVGSVSIPGSDLLPFGPTGGVVPSSAAFVGGRLYAGLEYDTESRAPTARTTAWSKVVADAQGLVHLVESGGTVEYFAALPGNPPGAPVLASSVNGNRVTLSWTPDPSAGSPSSYTVLAGSAPGAANLGVLPVGSARSFSVDVANGRYYATVVARNAFGPGPPSNEVVVQVGPPPCTLPPDTPGPLSYTRAGFGVTVSWGASATASSYLLEAGASTGATNVGTFPLGPGTSVSVSAPAGVYFVRLRAANACGVSAPSNEVVVAVDGAVPLPAAPTGLAALVSGNAVGLSWTPPTSGGTPLGYQLEAGYSPGAANAAVVTTGVPGLFAPGVPAAIYYVRVRAYNAAGLGPATSEVIVTVP